MNKEKYRNIKNGNVYILQDYAIDCTNERNGIEVVIYYPENNENFLCVREKNEFLVKFLKI